MSDRVQLRPSTLFHFSEDPTIQQFVPHVPRTNPTHSPAVWAIDEQHAPLYWFPRDCPRVTAWPRTDAERGVFRAAFCSAADRIHAIELDWLETLRTTTLYRYALDSSAFERLIDANGQWITTSMVEPTDMQAVGDLLDAHVVAGIELRVVPSLWPLHDLAVSDAWDFSIVRMGNARTTP